MPFDIKRLRKSAAKVTRFLRKNSKKPAANAIHDFRTSIRSLEAVFMTFGLDSKRRTSHLLRDLGKVRKRAGKVRTMDVLTENALTIDLDGEQDCLVSLSQHLGAERARHSRKLHRRIGTDGPQLCEDLERDFKRIQKVIQETGETPGDLETTQRVIAKVSQLSSALNRPARLTKSDLHPYRLKVKELRDILLLCNRPGDREFLDELSAVKDAIGEWHDWEELIAIAEELLDHQPSCRVMESLRSTSNSKYERALFLIRDLRNNLGKRSEELAELGRLNGGTAVGRKMRLLRDTRPDMNNRKQAEPLGDLVPDDTEEAN